MTPIVRNASKWVRTIHIYLSLPGLLLFAFFAGTGILLNHDFYGLDQVHTSSRTNRLEPDVIRHGAQDAVVKCLRSSFGISLPVTSYRPGSSDIDVTFSAPGERIHVLIDRENGTAEESVESRGLAGKMADLHKGAASGAAWRAVMDITCFYLLVSAISGTLLMLSLPKRRQMGFFAILAGVVAATFVYLVWVPR